MRASSFVAGLLLVAACTPAGKPEPEQRAAPSPTPTPAPSATHHHQLALGDDFSCALRGGAVYCWGSNSDGQLGDGTENDSARPVAALGIDDAISIVAAERLACALRADRSVWCWGDNAHGEVGRELPRKPITTPTKVVDRARAVAVGQWLTCVALETGKVDCWGELTKHGERPLEFDTLEDVIELGVASSHVCGLIGEPSGDGPSHEGQVACRGPNTGGMLGIEGKEPVPFVPNIKQAVALSLTDSVACVRNRKGGVACWGASVAANAGIKAHFVSPIDSAVALASLPPIKQVSVGFMHTCATTVDGRVACWGDNEKAQSVPTLRDEGSASPRIIEGLSEVVEVAAGTWHSCALTNSGSVVCWGDDRHGQLGAGDDPSAAERAVGLKKFELEGVTHIAGVSGQAKAATADKHVYVLDPAAPIIEAKGYAVAELVDSCVRYEDGDLSCFMDDETLEVETLGEETHRPGCVVLRDGALACDSSDGYVRIRSPKIPAGVLTVTSERDEICTVDRRGAVGCWQHERDEDAKMKMNEVALPRPATDVALTWDHGCARLDDGEVQCWRIEAPDAYVAETMSGMPPVESITSMSRHTCALTGEGQAWCWGRNYYGELGDGKRVDRKHPVAVVGVPPIVEIAGGDTYTCARTRAREVWCWGSLFEDRDESELGEPSGLVPVTGLP